MQIHTAYKKGQVMPGLIITLKGNFEVFFGG